MGGRTMVLSCHPPSYLHLWVGHRVPQIWFILIDIDKAGICGTVKHYLEPTDNQQPT